jgi:hypothetical protein
MASDRLDRFLPLAGALAGLLLVVGLQRKLIEPSLLTLDR